METICVDCGKETEETCKICGQPLCDECITTEPYKEDLVGCYFCRQEIKDEDAEHEDYLHMTAKGD